MPTNEECYKAAVRYIREAMRIRHTGERFCKNYRGVIREEIKYARRMKAIIHIQKVNSQKLLLKSSG